jgi:hypothetical protein
MKPNFIIIFLVLLVAAGFYFLGKKNGSGQMKTDVVQNVALIKEIAQLASLEVNGVTHIKVSNKGTDAGTWDKLKNYFTENTLQVSVPYEAKYGVDMRNQKMTIDTKAAVVTIYLPACKLMSMQLRLDKMESMSQAGIFNAVTIDDFAKAQKQLYASASATLENNPAYIKLAQDNITSTLNKYYQPLGYRVNCVFGQQAGQKQ